MDEPTTAAWWTWLLPPVAVATLGGALALPTIGGWTALVVTFVLTGAVFAAVYHAEVVAHRVGEPFGTLVLAVAVTIIEVALIVSLMLESPAETASLARDTAFAAVMIVCNGIVGMCLLTGAARHFEQQFDLRGALSALAVLAALTVLVLIVPSFTTTAPGPFLTASQLAFAAVVSLILYGAFVFVQTIRHRDFFLPEPVAAGDEEVHAPPPSARAALASLGFLIASLAAVVGLAKALSPKLEALVAGAGAPRPVVGVVVAGLVLMPEGLAALRAARANRLQTSMNLALGSSLASIGLTVPAVAVVALILGQPLALGLSAKNCVMLALTLLLALVTLGTGRTTVLQGIVHLVVFAAFLFLTVVP